jgi:hypothetical protein
MVHIVYRNFFRSSFSIWKWTVVKIMNFQVLSMFFSISTQLLRKLTISEKRQILSISWIVAVKMWIMLILQLRLCVKGSENQAWIILFHVQMHSSIWLHAMNEWRNKPEGYIQNWLLGDIPIALPTWTNPRLARHISSYQVIQLFNNFTGKKRKYSTIPWMLCCVPKNPSWLGPIEFNGPFKDIKNQLIILFWYNYNL